MLLPWRAGEMNGRTSYFFPEDLSRFYIISMQFVTLFDLFVCIKYKLYIVVQLYGRLRHHAFLLVNANETSIARGQKALARSLARSLLPSLDFVKYFMYGNYNVPYYNAADQCIRLSPKMASFAAENTQDNLFLFYDQKTPSWNSELKEINQGNTRPRKKVDIEI